MLSQNSFSFPGGVQANMKMKRAKSSGSKDRAVLAVYNKLTELTALLSELVDVQELTDTIILQVITLSRMSCALTVSQQIFVVGQHLLEIRGGLDVALWQVHFSFVYMPDVNCLTIHLGFSHSLSVLPQRRQFV